MPTKMIRVLLTLALVVAVGQYSSVSCAPVPELNELVAKLDVQSELADTIAQLVGIAIEDPERVFASGAVPKLIDALSSSSDPNVEADTLQIFGNIAGVDGRKRDALVEQGALEPVLKLYREGNVDENVKQDLVYFIQTMTHHKRIDGLYPNTKASSQLLPVIKNLIEGEKDKTEDTQILVGATCALGYATDGGDKLVKNVVDAGLTETIVKLASHPDPLVKMNALMSIQTISGGTNEQSQLVIDAGFFEQVGPLIKHDYVESDERFGTKKQYDTTLRRALFALSNIAAGPVEQRRAIVDHGLVPFVVKHLQSDNKMAQRYATYVVDDLLQKNLGTKDLLDAGVVTPLARLVESYDSLISHEAVRALYYLIQGSANDKDSIVDEIEKSGAATAITDLANRGDMHAKNIDALLDHLTNQN